jgi:putative PIN family toxin of toxin-antitoxin system
MGIVRIEFLYEIDRRQPELFHCATIKSMRVVLDTNILVSACLKPGGLESRVSHLAVTGKITACVTAEILAEYRDVLSRPKLASVHLPAEELLAALERAAMLVETTARISSSVDDDDNRFLECAEAAAAEYLITGNLRHYPAEWGPTRIVNARTFISVK